MPAARVAWSATDCAWAAATLAEDQRLDAWEEHIILDGDEWRYPFSEWKTYREWARRWGVALGQARGVCAHPAVLPSMSAAQASVGWFEEALATHPGSSAWDARWSAAYQRLISLFEALP